MTTLSFTGMNGEQILHLLEQESVRTGVSDIHFSPEKESVRIELRLHGVLTSVPTISYELYEQIMRFLKFIAKLKLNVTNVPQDGQYTFVAAQEGGSTPSRIVNVRIATLPSRFGETTTLRLLDPARGIQPLATLGFDPTMEKELQRLATLPHGLILVTGPTGSGKTTTLYALLAQMIGTSRNIITLEDPIEYEIPGIVQSEVDPEHNYTFVSGLRAILRHDPNIILVGEIRDKETAQTAVDASLTGHLVLATLHTNTATEAIPRLLTMGVSPFTFAPALRAILAQRLVRTLTEEARANPSVDPSDPSVYGGRTVIAELLLVSPTMRSLIQSSADASSIEAQATKDGLVTMRERAKHLVEEHRTTSEEVARVTME